MGDILTVGESDDMFEQEFEAMVLVTVKYKITAETMSEALQKVLQCQLPVNCIPESCRLLNICNVDAGK